jgi:hypothetical protein
MTVRLLCIAVFIFFVIRIILHARFHPAHDLPDDSSSNAMEPVNPANYATVPRGSQQTVSAVDCGGQTAFSVILLDNPSCFR